MLNEEQQDTEVKLTGGQVIIALQVISRLVSSGGLKDMELSPVGSARDSMVEALETATGVNFDQAKAQQEALQRQRIAQARAAQQAAAEEAAAESEGDAPDEAKADAPAEVTKAPAGNSHVANVEAE